VQAATPQLSFLNKQVKYSGVLVPCRSSWEDRQTLLVMEQGCLALWILGIISSAAPGEPFKDTDCSCFPSTRPLPNLYYAEWNLEKALL
jgi:hypothetical protein